MAVKRTALACWMAGQDGVKLTELAKELGVSQGYLSRLRSGQRRPGPALAARLAARTGLSALELLGLAEESKDRGQTNGR